MCGIVSGTMLRRRFLHATLIPLAAMGLAAGCAPGSQDDLNLAPGERFFPQSVASGDPRPDSVIVWTRVFDEDDDGDLAVLLQVAANEDFSGEVREAQLVAEAGFDGCVKAKVTGLDAATTYYYRFVYRGEQDYVSRIGRTKTAPAPDADVPVRFAFVSCQDFNGRWFNTYWRMADLDLDFVVHLGDYIYETTGDEQFQTPTEDRRVTFTDTQGAIVFNEGEQDEYFAAKSLDNYRQLYQVYRGDRALQAVHERFPMIITWDDHEFTNDCHGATGTYFGGREDEYDLDRRKVANQAWFEYMPIDYRAGDDFVYDPTEDFPGDLVIYREFGYGKNLHLFMTDARTWRNDHPIPEGALPGAVTVSQSDLIDVFGSVPDEARPYIEIDSYQGGVYADFLRGVVAEDGFNPELVAGNVSVDYINAAIGEAADPPPIDPEQLNLDRGLSYYECGKLDPFGSFGSRTLVVKPTYDLMTKALYELSGGASEVVLGEEQREWLIDGINGSDRTWKVWGNPFLLCQASVDLSNFPIPADFKRHYYLSVDFWEGHRNRRNQVLDAIADTENVVAITGDIHAFMAGIPWVEGEESRNIVEFVTSSISSSTFQEILASVVATNPGLSNFPEAAALVEVADTLLSSGGTGANPNLGFSDITRHGFATVEASAGEMITEFHVLEREGVTQGDLGEDRDALAALFSKKRFRVVVGDKGLYRESNGAWQRWNPETGQWVA